MNYQELIDKIKSRELVLSFSSLKQFAKSPEHFVRYKIIKPEATPAMIFGNLVDCFVFDQQDKFNEQFFISTVYPSTDNQKEFCSHIIEAGRLNGGKIDNGDIESAFLASYKKGDPQALYISLKPYIDAMILGKTVVTQSQVDHAKRMKEKLYLNKAGGALMNRLTSVQHRVEWEYMGWKFIGYIDGLGVDLEMDLKTTDADPDKIKRFVYQNKTYMQLGMYAMGLAQQGITVKEYKVCALDSNLNVSVSDLDNDYILYGIQEFKTLMRKFTKCVLMNRFEYNYDFHGKFKGEYHLMKPTYAEQLMPIIDDEP